MYHYISNALSEVVHLNIVVESHTYMMQGTPVGELMFKMLMQKSVINTRATSYQLRDNLRNLDT